MTLDEAIIHAENEVWKNSREADRCFSHGGSWYEEKAKSCKACADEHRQLAEWLKELKAYRETYPYGVDRFNGSDTPQTEVIACPLQEESAEYFKWLYEDAPQTETSTNGEKLQSGVEVKQMDCPWK